MIARYIHDTSKRQQAPFVSVNCAAIPENLLEAELFGFERGAFTGAVQQHLGKFERAHQGTLLLDEISELPVHLQSKLLRVLQEDEIDRLGGTRPIAVDSRVIATTNRDPVRLIEEMRFREDLYFRLNVIRIECHPLRGRLDAILCLAKQFLNRSSEEHGRGEMEISVEALRYLGQYRWPGNVRELENAIERAVFLTDGNTIEPNHLEGIIESRGLVAVFEDGTLAAMEKRHILSTIQKTGGNQTRAAGILGITSRTLRNKLREYRRV